MVYLDYDIIRTYERLTRKRIEPSFAYAFLVRRDGDDIKLVPNTVHIHGADSHGWLPSDMACIRVIRNPFASAREVVDVVLDEIGDKLLEE